MESRSSGVADPISQVLWRQLPQFLPVNTTICIEKDTEWQSTLRITQRAYQIHATKTRQSDRKRQRLPFQESAHRTWLINSQSQHLKAFPRMFKRKGIQHGQFFDTGGAPGRPEIHQQGLAPKGLQVQFGS